MPWFRLEDSFYDNPKVSRAGNAAIGLWVRCATWSARHLTDGHIPVDIMRGFGRPTEAAKLETVGMWTLVEGEYLIPDWLEYNPSAAEVKRRRSDAAAAKRAGGLARSQQAHRDEHGHFT
jgi:hypothetical protein